MKRIITILFLLIGFIGYGQLRPSGFPSQYSSGWFRQGYQQSDSGTIIAKRDTTFSPKFTGTIVFRPQDRRPYYFDSTLSLWNSMLIGSDTNSLSNRINFKLPISDTAAMLSSYFHTADTTDKWAQTVFSRNDTLFYVKNGIEVFVDTLSRGGGGGTGTVESVGMSVPSAFNVSGGPITSTGTFVISGAGSSAQYIRGNGTLATMDTSAIPDFFYKVRGLFSGSSPLSISNGTVSILDASTAQKGAASFSASDFSVSSGAVSLANVVSAGSCTGCVLNVDDKGRVVGFADGPGGATDNENVGVGFRILIDTSQKIKTAYNGFGTRIDSVSNSDGLTWKADTTRSTGLPSYFYVDSTASAVTPKNRYSVTKVLDDSLQLVNDLSTTPGLGINYYYSFDSSGNRNFTEDKYIVAKVDGELRNLRSVDTSHIYRGIINKIIGDWRYDPDDVSTVDDSAMCLVTNSGARLKRYFDDKIFVDWFGAKGDGTTDDAPAFQKMFDWMATQTRGTWTVGCRNRIYLINDTVNLPVTLSSTSTHEFILFDFYGVTIKTTATNNRIFRRISITGTDVQQMISDYKVIMKGANFEGGNLSGTVALDLGAFYGNIISDCHFNQFDTAIIASFWLLSTIKNCFFTLSKSVGLKCQSGNGVWPGGTVAGSAFNSNTIDNCRFFNGNGSYASLMLLGADQTYVHKCVSEGFNPRYNFYMDYQLSTNVLSNIFDDIWLESAGGTHSVNTGFYLKSSQILIIKNLQRTLNDTIFHIDAPAANSSIIFDGFPYFGNIPSRPFNAGGSTLSGSSVEFKNILYGIYTLILDSTKWVGGVVPSNLIVHGQVSSNSGYTMAAQGRIRFEPDYNSAPANRAVNIRGGINFLTDDSYYIGGVGSSNNRPRRLLIGSEGVRVSKNATNGFGFGDVNNVPTQYWSHINDTVTRITSTGGIDLPGGTTAQRPGHFAKRFRWNTDTAAFEYSDGSAWNTIASRDWVRNFGFATQSALNDTAAAIRSDISANTFTNGLTNTSGTVSLGGALTGTTTLEGNQIINLGLNGNKLNALFIHADNRTSIFSGITYKVDATNTDADYTVPGNTIISEITDVLTTDRTLTMPSAVANGQMITLVMRSSAGVNHYNLAAAITDNKTGTTFTQLDWSTTYDFMVDQALTWRLIRKY